MLAGMGRRGGQGMLGEVMASVGGGEEWWLVGIRDAGSVRGGGRKGRG